MVLTGQQNLSTYQTFPVLRSPSPASKCWVRRPTNATYSRGAAIFSLFPVGGAIMTSRMKRRTLKDFPVWDSECKPGAPPTGNKEKIWLARARLECHQSYSAPEQESQLLKIFIESFLSLKRV